MPIYLQLLHGRNDPAEQLDDWGFDGPLLGPFEWVHTTYNVHMNFASILYITGMPVHDETGPLDVFKDDLFQFRGKYYGDWEFVDENNTKLPINEAIIPTPEDFESVRFSAQ